MGFADQVLEDPEARFMANPHVSGRDGGKDLNLRAFGRDGVHLVGRVVQVEGSLVTFADDVVERLEAADQASREIEHGIDEFIEAAGIDAPPDDREPIDWVPAVVPEQVDLVDEGISSVIWATGYHLDFSWIDAPVFGERDYPIHQRGITDVPGLYFIGLAALHTVGSSLFWGVGRDAEFLASHIASS
jgi:putative flavoprotein involved in K+ transport